MWKYYLAVLLVFGGCSGVTFNAAMCGKIASEPNAVMPEECRNYSEEEAQKAFDKTKHQQQSKEDIIEFSKEQ